MSLEKKESTSSYIPIETLFNNKFLKFLTHLKLIVDETEELSTSIEMWSEVILKDPMSTDACMLFFEGAKDVSEALMGVHDNGTVEIDAQLYLEKGDFFNHIFGLSSLNTPLIMGSLDMSSRTNVWEAIQELYRLAVLISVYVNMPVVKNVVNMMMKPPGVKKDAVGPPQDMLGHVTSMLKDPAKLRKLMSTITNSDSLETSECDLQDSLKRVLSAYQMQKPRSDDKSAKSGGSTNVPEGLMGDLTDMLKKFGINDRGEMSPGVVGDGVNIQDLLSKLSSKEETQK
jgi:hypothetical protein